jgi:putative nucleotidyltransferase with HDIG domain
MGITNMNRWPVVGGLLVSLAAAVSLVALFLYTFDAKLLFSTRTLALMYSAAVTTVVLAVVLGKAYPQFVPLPAIALLLSIFFGQRAAVAVTFPMAIFIAVDHLIDFNNFVALVTASGAAIATYSRRRNALVSTGLVIGMAQAFGFLTALSVSQSQITLTAFILAQKTGLEFLGGIASSVVAIGMLPFIENIFGLVTPFRLAELTDADQPLLRRLEEHAPGTYQHSLGVANLAEAGARAVGADVNLVRAGAYFHDIGKMARPKYFIENQLGATNPHDSMTPEQSRERVLAHVTDGLELAKQYALPKAVQDFIPMHQGTSLMAYFYHKACMRDGVDNVQQDFYRYPGPKPQSKETSIVMLADVSEAVTHSMKDPTEEEIDAAISKVFQNRWDDGQFSESGLTYAELQRVKKAFVRVWRTLHHDRLKYPSTTTGRMPIAPTDLPTAASLANVVTGNEFPASLPSIKPDTGSNASEQPQPSDSGQNEKAAAAGENGKGSPSPDKKSPGELSPNPDSEPNCC